MEQITMFERSLEHYASITPFGHGAWTDPGPWSVHSGSG
jgi:hypothetical protein